MSVNPVPQRPEGVPVKGARQGARPRGHIQIHTTKQKTIFGLVVVAVFVLSFCLGLGAYATWRKQQGDPIIDNPDTSEILSRKVLYDGLTMDDIDISGMDKTRFTDAMRQLQARRRLTWFKTEISLDGVPVEVLNGDAINYTIDIENAWNQAYAYGRTGNTTEKLAAINAAKANGFKLTATATWSSESIEAYVNEFLAKHSRAAVPAEVLSFDPSRAAGQWWEYKPDEDGLAVVGGDTLSTRILEELNAGRYETKFDLTLEPVKAEVTIDKLKTANSKLSSCTTTVSGGTARRKNIDLASKAMHGKIIRPGETFSFNLATGERTIARGYDEATAIVNGVSTPDVGGGVCQVAGTLYNAVVKADLTIVERRNHSVVSNYLDPSLDATVWWGQIDLKFRNDGDTPVFLVRDYTTGSGSLTISVYGQPLPDGISISLVSERIESIPAATEVLEIPTADLPAGVREKVADAGVGTRSIGWKVIKNAQGEVIDRIEFTRDTYPARKESWRVGTGPSASPSMSPPVTLDPTPTPLPATPTPLPATPTPLPATPTPVVPTPTPDPSDSSGG